MVVPKQGQFEHKIFTDIEDYLLPGDVLVVNETAVLPARLLGIRESTGAHIEVLLLKQVGEDRWETLVRPGRRVCLLYTSTEFSKDKAVFLVETPSVCTLHYIVKYENGMLNIYCLLYTSRCV